MFSRFSSFLKKKQNNNELSNNQLNCLGKHKYNYRCTGNTTGAPSFSNYLNMQNKSRLVQRMRNSTNTTGGNRHRKYRKTRKIKSRRR